MKHKALQLCEKCFSGKGNRKGKGFSKEACWAVTMFSSMSYKSRSLNYLKIYPYLHTTLPYGLGTLPVACASQTTAVASSTTCLFKVRTHITLIFGASMCLAKSLVFLASLQQVI